MSSTTAHVDMQRVGVSEYKCVAGRQPAIVSGGKGSVHIWT